MRRIAAGVLGALAALGAAGVVALAPAGLGDVTSGHDGAGTTVALVYDYS